VSSKQSLLVQLLADKISFLFTYFKAIQEVI